MDVMESGKPPLKDRGNMVTSVVSPKVSEGTNNSDGCTEEIAGKTAELHNGGTQLGTTTGSVMGSKTKKDTNENAKKASKQGTSTSEKWKMQFDLSDSASSSDSEGETTGKIGEQHKDGSSTMKDDEMEDAMDFEGFDTDTTSKGCGIILNKIIGVVNEEMLSELTSSAASSPSVSSRGSMKVSATSGGSSSGRYSRGVSPALSSSGGRGKKSTVDMSNNRQNFARDSNRFTVSANVESRRKVTFNLTYEEFLIRKLGTYRHVINVDPGQIVLDMSVKVIIEESSRISYLQVPTFRTTNEVLDDVISGDDPLARIHRMNPYTAVVTWEPTPEQQEELVAQGLRGQLFVNYDVDREQHPQQILINEGYFVHFFSPPDLPPLAKHVTFVLDISGSMVGRKIHQLKGAMHKIFNDLRPTDSFSIVRFSSRVKVWNSNSSFSKFRKNNPEFNPVVQATKKNIGRAKMIIDGLDAYGATNIYKALKVALQISRYGKKQWKKQNTNSGSRQEHRYPEPMIIFLTDGEPTEGKTDSSRITIATTSKNKKTKASIFCLALGNDADFDFLKKLSLRNSGFARKIYEASDTALQLTDFYREVASPLLANVTFNYLPQQVEPVSLTDKRFYYFYSGSELVVSGHLQPTTPGELMQCEVKGRSPEGLVDFVITELPVVLQHETHVGLMERLWAYLNIKQLLDRADKKTGKKSALTKQVAELALKKQYKTQWVEHDAKRQITEIII